ncbi:unnamed protein product [Lymnaea stagnalis]|uniref:AIG1-type G domain-containing protein n=1 Tax=Lymnaea stagnalis TaxID=6523 RepID=A0AAV2H1D3_LYMST
MAKTTANKGKDIGLLLIGKAGSGKSATGNSILKKRVFESKAAMTRVTKCLQMERSTYKGRVLTVIDCPGIDDEDLEDESAHLLVKDEMKKALALNPQGYQAFLLVVRFGVRFTKEDLEIVQILKSTFGNKSLKQYLILLVTHGDNFDTKVNGSFKDWCASQTGVFKSLVDECGKRVVLIDNSTQDPAKIDRQIDQLLSTVDGMNGSGPCYRLENNENPKKKKEDLAADSNPSLNIKETNEEFTLIIQKLGHIGLENPKNRLQALEELGQRTARLMTRLLEQDKGSCELQEYIRNVQNIQTAIQVQVSVTQEVVFSEEMRRQQQAEIESLREDLKCLKEQHEVSKRETARRLNEIKHKI